MRCLRVETSGKGGMAVGREEGVESDLAETGRTDLLLLALTLPTSPSPTLSTYQITHTTCLGESLMCPLPLNDSS